MTLTKCVAAMVDGMAVRKRTPNLDDSWLEPKPPIDEAGRERLRNHPGVRYHKRDPNETRRTITPWVRVIKPVDVLWLLGRRTEDGESVPDQ